MSRAMEKETEKIIDELRKIRIEKKISLLKLSNDAKISHSHLYYIESKKVIPSMDVMMRLIKALGIKHKDIF